MSEFKSFDNIKDEEEIPVCINFSTIEYSLDSFIKNMENGTLSDNKIKDIISYGDYFDYDNFNNPRTRSGFQSIWTNHRFLKCVANLLKENPYFLNKVRNMYNISINKIAYDYYTANIKDDSAYPTIQLLFDIVDIVDNDYIIPLTAIIDKNTARFITISRFSSFNNKECACRLNDFIVNVGYEFTIKDIIIIYAKFYSNGFSELFNATMTDQTDYDQLTPAQQHMYDNISLAIADILESMPSSEMMMVIKRYGTYLMLMGGDISVRFSLKNLAMDFDRINAVVEDVLDCGIDIP